ncbi:hypothetical protein RI367_007408 [Sorochytrium milnesiophthora]
MNGQQRSPTLEVAVASSIEEIERVLDTFYAPTTSPQDRKQCQSWMLAVQRDESAWHWAWNCLRQSQNVNVQFFGAQTLQVKLARDWDTLPADSAGSMRDGLIEAIAFFSDKAASSMVMRKLCLALTTYAQKTVPHKWPSFFTSLFEQFERQYWAKGGSGDDAHFLYMALMEILTVCPEEFQAHNMAGTQRTRLTQEVLDAIPTVLSFLQQQLAAREPVAGYREKCLRCLLSWLHFGIPIATLIPLLNQVIELLPQESTFEAAVQVLCELVSHPSNARFEETICQGMLPLMVGGWIHDSFQRCFQGASGSLTIIDTNLPTACQWKPEEDEETLQCIAKLMSAMAETFPTYMVKHMATPLVQQFLDMMVQIILFPGYFGADQEISDIPLQAFYLIQETLADPPAAGTELATQSTNSSTDSLIDLTNDDDDVPAPTITLPPELEAATSRLFSNVLAALCSKVRWPSAKQWKSWPKDKQEKWGHFRRDAADTMLVCYYVLRKNALSIVLGLLQSAASSQAGSEDRWQAFEAVMFALKSMSEAIPADESEFVPHIINQATFSQMPLESIRLRQTTLRLLGCFAEWIKRHPETLTLAIELLANALYDASSASSAVRGLKDICDLCRDQLSSGFPYLLSVYQKVKDQLSRDEQGRDQVVAQLKMLAACCRGIQKPETDNEPHSPTRLQASDPTSRQLEAVLESGTAPNAALLQTLYTVLEETVALLGTDQVVMDALCSFIDTTMQSSLHLFHLGLRRIAQFVVSTFTQPSAQGFHACILDTASCAVCVYGERVRGAEHVAELRGMFVAVSTVVLSRFSGEGVVENYPDVAMRFSPSVLYDGLPVGLLQGALDFSIRCLGLQERLALKASIHFLNDFVGQDVSSACAKPYETLIREAQAAIAPAAIRSAVEGITYKVPRSYVPNLSDLLYRLISLLPTESRQAMYEVFADPAIFPNLTDEKRASFLKQILTTRQMKRFKDIVKELSMQTRGLENLQFV